MRRASSPVSAERILVGQRFVILSADDGIHAPSFDAVNITATEAITVGIAREGANVQLTWTGGWAPYDLERSDTLGDGYWSSVVTTNSQTAVLPIGASPKFFRVRAR